NSVLAAGGRVVGLAAPGMAQATRSQISDLTDIAKQPGAKGLVHLAVESAGGITSPVLKFLGEARAEQLAEAIGATPGDLVLIVADADIHVQEATRRVA